MAYLHSLPSFHNVKLRNLYEDIKLIIIRKSSEKKMKAEGIYQWHTKLKNSEENRKQYEKYEKKLLKLHSDKGNYKKIHT